MILFLINLIKIILNLHENKIKIIFCIIKSLGLISKSIVKLLTIAKSYIEI